MLFILCYDVTISEKKMKTRIQLNFSFFLLVVVVTLLLEELSPQGPKGFWTFCKSVGRVELTSFTHYDAMPMILFSCIIDDIHLVWEARLSVW